MGTLKAFDEITQPDIRHSMYAIINVQTGDTRPLVLKDFYETASDIKLHEGVPENIRTHFATALNLLIYSWFYYPFNVTAQFMAFVTLELALREKLKANKKASFKSLIQMAVEKGFVKDEGFSHIQSKGNEPLRPGEDEMQEPVKSYCEGLVTSIPYLRNQLSHGSSMLHLSGELSVKLCADFINQLYPNKDE